VEAGVVLVEAADITSMDLRPIRAGTAALAEVAGEIANILAATEASAAEVARPLATMEEMAVLAAGVADMVTTPAAPELVASVQGGAPTCQEPLRGAAVAGSALAERSS
jgi:hypothetical protein